MLYRQRKFHSNLIKFHFSFIRMEINIHIQTHVRIRIFVKFSIKCKSHFVMNVVNLIPSRQTIAYF